ncbi:ATP-binding protein [Nonomuraea sp. MTCD27]|uniref:ATP-binding protein n=1 Tax=Nonomuraea sp. MTCD27 TaxID=1676747 RepID=UPI0035BF9860
MADAAATNVLQHGGAGGALIAWSDNTGVSLEVVDAAGALTEAHLSIEPGHSVSNDVSDGVGLWLIQRLCDEVSLEDAAGSARLRLRRPTQATAS